jgi:predicted phosphoadenosine phosphosulfate sulfurtransferase
MLPVDVYTATQERLRFIFQEFERINVSFSAGKDSTVLLHMACQEARAQKRRITGLFIDWEAQFSLTIEHARNMFQLYQDVLDPLWVCLPFRTTNACSMTEPEWVCWAPEKRDVWVRTPPEGAITDPARISFYRDRMTFEEFIDEFGDWFGQGRSSVSLVGIRTAESLNRWRAVTSASKTSYQGRRWFTQKGHHWNSYPIYDWSVQDIWTFHAQTGLPYNPLYDRFHAAGLKLSQMRICEPYGDEQRRGLWLYHVIEPETWGKVCARVAGANTGGHYAGKRTNLLGDALTLPPGHTWKSYALFLLDTMPPPTAEHYRNKIAVYLKWYQDHDIEFPDCREGDTGAKDVGSWRRICKTLLKNDYWCKGLCFSPTRTDSYDRYQRMMQSRRERWNIFGGENDVP